MKTVSNAYKESMAQSFRNPSYVRIDFSNIDPAAAADGVWVPNNQLDYSSVDTLDYDYTYGATYATLETNRWLLNGTQDILPAADVRKDGYIGQDMSDENGDYSVVPILTRQFSEIRTLPGLTIIFDTRTGEFPKSIEIDYYLNGELLKQTVISEITDVTLIVKDQLEEVDKIEIKALSHLPNHRFRIERIIFGIIKRFDNSNLVSTDQSHDVDPVTRRLPEEKFSFTIIDYAGEYNPDNPTSDWEFVNEKSPISIRHGYEVADGQIEWLEPDNYIMNSKPSYKNYQATFEGTGLIGSMSDTYYKDTVGSKNLYDMAVKVLQDAGLTKTSDGGDPWIIDESLKNMMTVGVLPIDTHMNCLQLIAHAACCRLFTDSENIIHIEPFVVPETAGDFVVDFSTIQEDGQSFSKISKLKAVDVYKYNYQLGADSTTLYEEEDITATELHVEFSGIATEINVSVSGGTLVSSEIYGRAADLVLSAGTKKVTITGKTYNETSSIYRKVVSNNGEVDTEENSLITNTEMCVQLAEHMANYLKYRNTYDIVYRGNPELETQDAVTLQSKFTQSMKGLVLTNGLSFNGSLSGSLKVKVIE